MDTVMLNKIVLRSVCANCMHCTLRAYYIILRNPVLSYGVYNLAMYYQCLNSLCYSAVTHSNNFIQAAQEAPFGDIIINRGPFL